MMEATAPQPEPAAPEPSSPGTVEPLGRTTFGALIIEPGQLYLTIRFTNGYLSEILLGVLFLVIVLFVPRGIVPTVGEWIKRLRTRGRPASGTVRPPAPPPEASEAPAREAKRV